VNLTKKGVNLKTSTTLLIFAPCKAFDGGLGFTGFEPAHSFTSWGP
jgi:hypothetical protein